MPHNLAEDPRTGQMSMMYYRDPPWHGLGQRLDHPATSAEAIHAAGLDWEVVKQPLYVDTMRGYRRVEEKFMMMRADQLEGGPCFGIVSSNYAPLQNVEAFNFFDGIVGQKEAIYHTAGALGQGERVWILAKLPDSIRVIGDDLCEKYLLLSNSHDGESSVQVKFTPVRVVCQNTLTLALSQGRTIRVAHTRNLHARMRRAKDLLGIVKQRYEDITLAYQAMARVKMNKEKLVSYYRVVFPDPRDPTDEQSVARVAQNRNTAERYFRAGRGNQEKGVIDTLWAAYNGVTEMVDYDQCRNNTEQRLKNIWFGDGYLIKAKAFAAALEKMKEWAA